MGTSQEYDSTKFRLNRSVSLSKIDQDSSNKENSSNNVNSKKRKEPPSPPKAKVSIKETKAKYELQEKYRNQRNLKDVNKEKGKFKRNCKKTPSETVEDPVAKMLKEMMKEIRGEIEKVEDRVTTKLMTEITPTLNNMRKELQSAASQDIRRLVQEELELQRIREAKENRSAAIELEEEVVEGEEPEKNKKSKKNIKFKKPKKK